ncbi:hypothetical protein DN068_01090 [Taibaiella soli]|uniref:Uncharacterized protein n=1 Tax=Taibaiella soli TaxID=1649169 RepID=A0A2W2AMQ9_9BACT|nr:hypothetical protein DN068_01090 [Taibaiella soli]
MFSLKSNAQTNSIFYKNEIKYAEVITNPELEKGIGCYTKFRFADSAVTHGYNIDLVQYCVTDTICDTNFNSQKIIGCGDYKFLIWSQWRDSVQADLLKDKIFSSTEEREKYTKEHLPELMYTDKKELPSPTTQNIIIKNDSVWYKDQYFNVFMYTNHPGELMQGYWGEDSAYAVQNILTGLGDTTITWKGRKIDCYQFYYDMILSGEGPIDRLIKKEIVEKASGLPIMTYMQYYRCNNFDECRGSLKKLKLYQTHYTFIYSLNPAKQN